MILSAVVEYFILVPFLATREAVAPLANNPMIKIGIDYKTKKRTSKVPKNKKTEIRRHYIQKIIKQTPQKWKF